MEFVCQREAIEELQLLSKSDRHSILIEGCSGGGKSYLANMYGSMVGVDDIITVKPKVAEIRSILDSCYQRTNTVLLCIENLDLGVKEASYTLLKSLEEPISTVYIIVTCRNSNKVPDTIVSRSAVVSISPPVSSDLDQYAQMMNFEAYHMVHTSMIWKCAHTFTDIDTILSMNANHLQYFDSLKELVKFDKSIPDIIWALGHYDDESKTPTPIELVIRYIMYLRPDKHSQMAGVQCLRDLSRGSIASHVVLTKYAFEMKYIR